MAELVLRIPGPAALHHAARLWPLMLTCIGRNSLLFRACHMLSTSPKQGRVTEDNGIR